MIKVIKRDCTEVDFDKNKIENAIKKAMLNGSGVYKSDIAQKVADDIERELQIDLVEEVTIYDIEEKVFNKLIDRGERLTAKSYEGFRRIREFQRECQNSTDESITTFLDGTNE